MINVSFDVAKVQFNAKPVLSAKDRGTMKALKKAGAFVRSDARRSMRRRSKPAPPGKPPRVVNGQLKQFLFFIVDRAESVTIGPIKLREGGAPGLLEYGGARSVRRRIRGRRESVRVDYEPHPYMDPALKQVAPKVPDLFKNAFK